MIIAVPINIGDAREVVRILHRTHRPPLSGLFAIAATTTSADGQTVVHPDRPICGVVIVGRPVARHLDDGWTAEVTRCATDGCKNVCSFLYAAAWRSARPRGYRKLVTYTLASEPGTSLRAAGWKIVGQVTGRSWDTPSRPRVDRHPTQDKIRWEVVA